MLRQVVKQQRSKFGQGRVLQKDFECAALVKNWEKRREDQGAKLSFKSHIISR